MNYSKLTELGYKRSAKKCKEKFENVYKYHKRTKESRNGKAEGKTYKYFDQLEALFAKPQPNYINTPPPNNPINNIISFPIFQSTYINPSSKFANISRNNNIFSLSSTSSSTASDEEFEQAKHKNKKKKWKVFFKNLTKDVIKKQEELQNKFLEAIDKCENERIGKEEAWRVQEMTRIDKEHQILAQEVSTNAVFISFLQSGCYDKQNPNLQIKEIDNQHKLKVINQLPQSSTTTQPPQFSFLNTTHILTHIIDQSQIPNLQDTLVGFTTLSHNTLTSDKFSLTNNNTSSRWPRVEVEELIRLRSELDTKYENNGMPKGHLWEEISSGMRKIGYNRNSRRCKEKWENINKYFKKVKDSSKKRSQDAKTCSYFHQLDAMCKNKKNKVGNVEKTQMDNHKSLNLNHDDHDKDKSTDEED